MVSVAQRLEHWTVAPGVGGSSPLTHPILNAEVRNQNADFTNFVIQFMLSL